MVLGLGEGAINILLPKTELCPGKKVKGQIILSLDKPKKARELRIDLYGESPEHEYGVHENRRYVVREAISGERTYKNGEKFEFSFIVPENILLKSSNSVKAHHFQKFFGDRPSHWYLQASLNIPFSFDVSNRIGVTITSRASRD